MAMAQGRGSVLPVGAERMLGYTAADGREAIIAHGLIATDNTARTQVEEVRTKLNQRLRDQHS